MPLPLDNLAGGTTTSGTANFVITTTIDQYKTMIGSITNGATISYKAVFVDRDTDGTDFETGKGTWDSATNTLTRSTINTSSASGAAVDFGGSSVAVYVVLDAETLNSLENKTETTDRKILTASERTLVAGALQESALTSASGVKTLTIPDSTTVTTFTKSLLAATTDTDARVVLDLGGAADLDVGQIAGTVAAGDDGRFTGVETSALPAASRLDGTELLPSLQSGLGVKATSGDISGNPMSDVIGLGRNMIREFTHLQGTSQTFTTSTTGDTFGTDPAEVWVSGAGAAVSQASTSIFRYGVAACSTGTTGTGYAAIASTISALFSSGSTDADFSFIAGVAAPPNGTEKYTCQIGWFTDPAALATQGLFFECDENDGFWYAVMRNSTGQDRVSTAIAVDSAVGLDFGVETFRITYASNTATYYINGSQVAQHTTYLPTSSLNYVGATIIKRATAGVASTMYVDCIKFEADVTAASSLFEHL